MKHSPRSDKVLAGFEIPTGDPVEIPLTHLCVTGQTQQSGKTTTLEALVKRSKLRAIAFRTKRGEQAFGDAREIDAYFRDAGDWQFVSSILEASRGEKLKFERSEIIQACRGTSTLAEVHAKIKEAMGKKGWNQKINIVLDAYLEEVVPQIGKLRIADRVDLSPGLNVMDLSPYSVAMQSLVIRSVLEWVHEREEGVVTIIPEAWEFIPQNRGSPVKLSIERLIRKGAGLRNFVWLDAQDLGALHKDIIRSCAVMIFGVQREANEIKRNLANIPADLKKPPASEIQRLGIGEFFVCYGKQTVKTYIWPTWMEDRADAHAIAQGKLSIDSVYKLPPRDPSFIPPPDDSKTIYVVDIDREVKKQHQPPTEEDEMSKEDVKAIRDDLLELTKSIKEFVQVVKPVPAAHGHGRGHDAPPASTAHSNGSIDMEQIYQTIKNRLQAEAPKLLNVTAAVPELQVTEELKVIQATTTGKGALLGRLALMIHEGFFDTPRSDQAIRDELKRYGLVAQKSYANVTYSSNKSDLVKWGFLFVDNGSYVANPAMKRHIKKERE